MAIKLEVKELIPKDPQPTFPALMECGDSLVFIDRHPDLNGKFIAMHLTGLYAGRTSIANGIDRYKISTKSVTIQNVIE